MTREASATKHFEGAFRERAIELIRFSTSIQRTKAQMLQRPGDKARGWTLKDLPSGKELAKMQALGESSVQLGARYKVSPQTVLARIQAHQKAVEGGRAP